MADRTRLVNLGLTAVALVIGIAVVVLPAMGTIDVEAAVSLLGVGLAALAMAAFEVED